MTRDGDLYLMGRGRDGQLGRSSQAESSATERTVPTLVEYFRSQNLHVDDIALGANHTVALVSPRV